MRPALEALIADVSVEEARDALRGPEQLRGLRDRLVSVTPGLPTGERADNLLQALISLRVKFTPDEARARLETNLAMRRGGRA